jgi:hypothetical protein
MRKALVAFVCAGFVVAMLAATVGARDAKRHPSLRLVDSAPLTLRGTEFIRGERVRINVQVGGESDSRTARAGTLGGFVITFADATLDRCSGLFVVAVGASGSRATLKLPMPHCPVPLTPP